MVICPDSIAAVSLLDHLNHPAFARLPITQKEPPMADDGIPPQAEQTLIGTLMALGTHMGKVQGGIEGIFTRFDNLDKRLAEDRIHQQKQFDDLKEQLEHHDERISLVESLVLNPDESRHLSPVELVDARSHLKDTEKHLSPTERTQINARRTRMDRFGKRIGLLAPIVGGAVAFLGWLVKNHQHLPW